MVRGEFTRCKLEFESKNFILKSKLLGLNKHTCKWNGQPKENSSKGFAFYTLILVVLKYFYNLIGTSYVLVNYELWIKGYYSNIAKILHGNSLRLWIHGTLAMPNIGMFLTVISSDSFQILGMAERGMLSKFFRKRSRHGTPLTGILISASRVLLLF